MKVLHNAKNREGSYHDIRNNGIKLNINIMIINGISTAMSLGSNKNWEESARE